MAAGDYQPLGMEVVTTGQLSKPPPNARHAVIQAEGGDYRYRDDGVAASAAVGMRLYASTSLWYTGDLSHLTVAQVSANVGQLNVSYYT